MEYRILGPLEIADGERTIEVTAPKQRALLLSLLLRGRQVVPVDGLVDALWEDRPPPSAANLVQVYVSQLRRALGEAAIETHPTGYLAPVGPDQLDAARFERLLADGRAATVAGDPRLGALLLRRGLALWRGSALADVADESFASTEARRLEELRLVCLEERIGADLALGRHQDVASELAALVDEHPLRERLRRHLMLALYRCGRQTDALDVYRDARRILSGELGLEPGVELRELERAILRQDESLAAPAPDEDSRPQLPTPTTPLVDRELDLAELLSLVRRPEARLITLAGAAGSGKTRLALALAHASGGDFADGCALAEVAALRDPELVLPAIARSLGIAEAPEEPIESTLATWLSARELLLVVDNLEHLADAGTALTRLSATAPGVTFVITSRRVLHLSGEHVFPVSPLAEDDAVELFVQRAHSLQPTFALTAENEADVREICRRLDGLPLALELAAARTGTLTPRALRERLTERLSVLTGGPHDLPARQQTLRETLDWSANLLEEPERRALSRMAVFPGGCTLESAETVCEADLDILSTLIDHSLAHRADAGGEPRFAMFETVREYGLELLGGARREAQHSLALYFCDLAEAINLTGAGQDDWVVGMDAEHDNVRAALDYTVESGDTSTEQRLLAAVWRYWWVRGYLAEGRARIDGCLARADGESPVLPRVLNGGAGLAWTAGDYERARALAAEGLAAARAAGDTQEELAALNVLGVIAMEIHDFESARHSLEDEERLAAAAGLEVHAYVAKLNLGVLALDSGDAETAVPIFEEVLAYHRRRGHVEGIGFGCLNLGQAAYRLDRHNAARGHFEEARSAFESIGFRELVACALQGLAAVEARDGKLRDAATLLGRAAVLLEEVGASPKEFFAALVAEVEEHVRAGLGEEGFDALMKTV